jgi:hypothetical protein
MPAGLYAPEIFLALNSPLGGLGELKKINDIENRTSDLPACSIVS